MNDKNAHPPNQLHLLKTRRFLPLFLTQFLGAFNDNAFKNALVILITYRIATQSSISTEILITLAAGIFILPFFLFSALAGQLADKFEKSRLIRITKLAEIILMAIAMMGFLTKSVFLLMLVLFLLGAQATFFGPIKYAILPTHLREDELVSGNAFIEAGTFLAILTGTILGGILILMNAGAVTVSILCILVAISGWLSSIYIPRAAAAVPELKIGYNIIQQTLDILRFSAKSHDIFLCILGISWFWLIGATFLSQFPTFAKNTIGADGHVVTLFLSVFSIGIAIGSMFCNRLLKGRVHATYVPLAALGMTIFMVDLFFASTQITSSNGAQLISASQFLVTLTGWHILIDLLLIAICGGLFIVPLYAILQIRSAESHRARVIASNNVMNALFMVAAAILTSLMFILHFTVPQIFLAAAIGNAIVAIYICKLLPDALIKSIFQTILTTLYKVKVVGLENFDNAGNRVLIIANHTSFLDAALIASFLPEKLTFAINTNIAKKWWIKPIAKLVDLYPLDPTNPMATKALIELIRQGKKCVIFPEGRLTMTGSLMKIYEGPSMIAEKSGATLLPIRIQGAQYTIFSRLKGKVRIRLAPQITLTLLKPCTFPSATDHLPRERRHKNGLILYDIMTEMMFTSSRNTVPLFQALLDASKIHGKHHLVMEDTDRIPINYQQFITRSFILGKLIAKNTQKNEYVGVLLPNMISTAVTFFALQAFGRVPAMLNYSSGIHNVRLACLTAKINTVYTSKKFIQAAGLEKMLQSLEEMGITIYQLEDERKKITFFDKIIGWIAGYFPQQYYQHVNQFTKKNHYQAAENPAVVLFTSGSEGTPKGVVLSHNNIHANYCQISSRVDFGPADKIFNSLPLFHSFGLTGGTILPLLSGMKIFFYPSPLHYRVISELIYDTNSTILFSTDTFLSNYAKFANAYDFYSIRYVFAGAEKLKESTRKIWSEQFGVRIFEGYGATETAPILASNTPMHNKSGTVGRLMPGISYRLESVPGIVEGGKLMVSGPNIMLGYLLHNAPGQLQPPPNNEYDTGDIVSVDDMGYVSILGRVKRFAKIGGEMISLTAVEGYLNTLWPGYLHAVLAISDEKKGEQLVLITNYMHTTREAIIAYMRDAGISEINIPKKIITMEKMPLLATGKVDYVALKAL